jgi:2'-5' RNA ligase
VVEGEQRLFIAVPLPPDAVADCAALIDGVRSGPLGRVPRWVQVPNLHLTVRFLGATPAERVQAVAAAVDAALDGIRAFDVELAGAGAFPDARRPRTLWLGIRRGAGELGAMARALDGALAPLGWPPEDRPYRPHLTVARLDAAPRADGAAIAQALDAAANGWHTAFVAREAVLFRSHMGGGPPRHERLLEHELAGA